MKKILSILCIVSSCVLMAQNGAHTATKLNAISAVAIDPGLFEFEPNFTSTYQFEAWDDKRNKFRSLPSDSVSIESSLSFRINHSPIKNMEVGAVIPADVSEAYVGVKYIFVDSSAINITSFIGSTIPMGNRTLSVNNRAPENYHSYGIGLGLTHDFSDKLGLDVSAEYQLTGPTNQDHSSDLFLFADVGYYPTEGLLLLNSFGYQLNSNRVFPSNLFSIYPGVTVETGEFFVIALNAQMDLTGRNAMKTVGGNLALTLMFD